MAGEHDCRASNGNERDLDNAGERAANLQGEDAARECGKKTGDRRWHVTAAHARVRKRDA